MASHAQTSPPKEVVAHRAHSRRWRSLNPEKEAAAQRRKDLKRRYGITPEEYDSMLLVQGGVCAICGLGETKIHHQTGAIRSLAVDHNHETGVVRSLLCYACNAVVGLAGENPATLRAAADYLESHSG